MKKYDEFLKENKAKKIWNAAVYVRLSKEDGDKIESDSITSQKDILSEFVNHKDDIKISDFYIDDGWSGANFERPEFSRMMSDIYVKKVNCVIVKDLSRFGRNYADSSRYIDDIFVKLNIRFIALNSGVDTICEHTNPATQCITVGIQNVINESYIANTSVSIRGALDINRKQGKFIGSFATYGYLKDPDDHHKLVIDDEAAEVVRTIFKWFIEGKSVIGITKSLNSLGIPNPSEYKRQKGFNYKHTNKNNDGLWCDSTVRRMLRNQMYIGNMVQGKNTNLSYKIKKCRAKPKDEWIIVEGTHEPIIDKETFEKAQSLFNRNTRTSPKKTEVDLFSGFVKCADCHRAMSKKINNHAYGVYKYYRCVTASKKSKTACSPHSIRIDVLEKTVLSSIQNMIDTAIELEKILDKINKQSVKNGDTLTKKALDTAREYGKRMLRITFIVSLIGCVVILAIRPMILDFYRDKLTETAIYYLGIFIIMTTWRFVGEGINTCLICGCFRGGGDTRFGMIVDTIFMWLVAVPLTFLAAYVFKLPPVWVYFVMTLDEFEKMPVVFIHYFRNKWLTNITRDFE